MNSVRFCLVLLIFLPGVSCAFNHKVVPSCSEHDTVCSFKFDVRYKFSMVYNDEKGFAKPIVIRNGTLLKGSSHNKEEFELLTPKGESLFSIKQCDSLYHSPSFSLGIKKVIYEKKICLIEKRCVIFKRNMRVFFKSIIQFIIKSIMPKM